MIAASAITDFSFSPGGSDVAVATREPEVRFWTLDRASPRVIDQSKAEFAWIEAKEPFRVSHSESGVIEIARAADGTEVARLDPGETPDFSAIRERLAQEGHSEHGEVLQQALASAMALGGHHLEAISPDGKYAVTSRVDDWLRVWRTVDARVLTRIPLRYFDYFGGRRFLSNPKLASFSRDSSRVALALDSGIEVWDLSEPRNVRSLPPKDATSAMTCSTSGRYLAIAGREPKLYRVDTGESRSLDEGAVAFLFDESLGALTSDVTTVAEPDGCRARTINRSNGRGGPSGRMSSGLRKARARRSCSGISCQATSVRSRRDSPCRPRRSRAIARTSPG